MSALQEWQASWKERHQHPSAVAPRLFTVGRLDVASTGLIFVTNDGKERLLPVQLQPCRLLRIDWHSQL